MKFYRSVFEFLSVFSAVRNLNGNTCGTLSINPSTTAEGNAVQLHLKTSHIYRSFPVEWRQESVQILCSESGCSSDRYKWITDRYSLRIENVVLADAGIYRVRCQNNDWSDQATLSVIKATSASKEQEVPLTNISSKSTTENRSMTNGATVKEESGTVKTEVIDTGQVTTVVVTGGVAVGVMLTVIVVVIFCKKRKEVDRHRASQKSGPTQTCEGTDGQDDSLPNNSGQPHSRERVASAVQHEAEHNPGALYYQQASSSVAEQINSEYATVVPTKDINFSAQQMETNKAITKEEEGTTEYATVVKNRQPGCSVEQSTQGSKDKNEHGLVYADLDLVCRPQPEAASKEYEATEYVSIDIQKTTTLKSRQKQL